MRCILQMNENPPARVQWNRPALSLRWQTEWIRSSHLTHMLLIKSFISFLCTHGLLLQSPLRDLCLPPRVWKTFPCSLHTNLLRRTRGPHQTVLPCNSSLNACFQNKPKKGNECLFRQRFWHVTLNKHSTCRIYMLQKENNVSIRLTLLSTRDLCINGPETGEGSS